ncbi:efflux RND transporter periplasmic adaptor subunit [Pseudoalteromonas sp. SCSIO 43095]|jgi:membrane fusion protein, copper/silver efflux system|uniref:efflux RND transporter periplasmic adaptor subunit n=1 Tax=Pseudoalteromonas TaxID=53246 RepID=UPI000849BB71|nr:MULTISPECIES: efflux RND transporter periplasmic adaptor subunit [Pseudoalteromonas]MCK8103623.1 efflux RND transporter periplasmic adaptor subunit [Pseudoalteromonas sp. 2CM36K]MCK8134895.1 efflux RND transporter periplasmic adaptor subunit [Pseudoalteromonas sp. 2CM28B]MDX1360180.1 efflux RND transporter periplasmic adaptor subunit [Pseudoalteromonas tetraodonis]MDX1726732.1 efflux RND transporter periplasmic adaptor subunit [Pseudoalteromonas tetraodonis]ODS13625.1 efflux transporter per
MNTNLKLSLVAICSAALTAGVLLSLPAEHTMPSDNKTSSKKEPLYWVAPMDSNYRRDEPGLSPMGMDLVPVYEESDSGENEGPGSVKISPTVINNLGVRTAPVEFAVLENEVNTVGYVQYNQDQLIHIHPRVEGWVETLYVKAAGDQVKQDEPLYTLYSPQLVNAQEEFVLALKRNNPVLIRAAKARLKSLNVSEGFISRLQKSQQVLQNITFYSRQGGVVDELNIREGFYVKPDTSMMSIAQLDEVWVEAEVFERQAELIRVGLPVTMTLDYLSGQRWQGQVDYIYPTLDAKNRTLRVRLRFNNQGHQLKPNMFAQVSIHSQKAEKQLIVPKEAVIRTGSQNRIVIALGEGRFKSVEVTLGRSDATHTEILSGVMAEDEVVTSAQFLIDSESSKSSDFKRMQAPSHSTMTMSDSAPSMATVNGVINSIDPSTRVMNISREAIEKWGRGPATMDFVLAKNVTIEAFKLNDEVTFTFSIEQGEFVIHTMTSVHAMHSQHE